MDMHKQRGAISVKRVGQLEEALKRFYDKAHAVAQAVEGAIVMDHIHGHSYEGPTFIENFKEVEELLGINPERAPGVPIGHET